MLLQRWLRFNGVGAARDARCSLACSPGWCGSLEIHYLVATVVAVEAAAAAQFHLARALDLARSPGGLEARLLTRLARFHL